MTTQQTKANKIHPWSLRAVWHFRNVYFHAQANPRTNAPDKFVFLDCGKTQIPEFELQGGVRMAQVLGSPLYMYICGTISIKQYMLMQYWASPHGL